MNCPENKTTSHCERDFAIDALKAFSALTVILIHVTSHYTSTPYIEKIWQWSHFAVGVFVFASGYLIAKYNDRLTTIPKMWAWLKRRLIRLLQPYYIYIAVHIALTISIPSVFDKSVGWSPGYIIDTLLLDGGFGQNWIPRTFIFLSLLYLLIQLVRRWMNASSKIYLWTFLASLGLSLLFLFPTWEMEWDRVKFYQAFTWIAFMLLGILFRKAKNKRRFILAGVSIGALLTVAGQCILPELGTSANIFENKYPPTLYFILYNVTVALLLYAISEKIEHLVKSNRIADTAVTYLSKESYTIFFVHFIVLDALEQPTGFWLTDFLIVSAVTLISVILWKRGVLLLSRLFSSDTSN